MTPVPSWRERLLSPVAILLLAAILRIALVLRMGDNVWFWDTNEYAEMARWMLHGQGFPPSNCRSPLFPGLMAIAFRIAGVNNWTAVGLLNVIPGLALVAVAMRLGRLVGGTVTGRIAGLLTAVMPIQVFTTALLYPTTLYALCLTSMALLAIEMVRRPTPWKGVGLGLVLVAGWLADQVFVAPAAAVLLWLGWHARARSRDFALPLALAAVVGVTLALPYVMWRKQSFQANAVFMNKAQYVQHFGRSDSLMNRFRWLRLPEDSTWQALPLDAYVRQETELLRTRPLDYVHDYLYEVIHFWQPLATRIQTQNQYTSQTVRWFGAIVFIPIVVLQWIGLFLGRAERRERVLLMLVPLAIALFYGFFFTQTRYRAPSEPMMIVLAVLGFQRLFPRAAGVVFGDRRDRAS